MSEQELADPAQSVVIAYVYSDALRMEPSWMHSIMAMRDYDLMNHCRLVRPIRMRCGTDGLVDCRNQAVQMFLDDHEADWLFWTDTDMGFEPDTVDRLFEVADPVERPVVGGLCFANIYGSGDGLHGWDTTVTPTIFDWAQDGDAAGFAVRWNYPRNTVTRCHGTGSACILIHRSVFEKIAAEFGPVWYERRRNPSTGQMISEDLSFCVRANALQIPVYVHTGVQTNHAKTMWVNEQRYWQERAVNAPPWTPQRTPEQAAAVTAHRAWTTPRYAIVPTHNRPARLLALVVSLGTQCDAIIVLDNASAPPVDADKLRASVPDEVTVEVIRDEEQPPNLARFWNEMLDRCAELAKDRGHDVWDVAVLNDDAVVPAGWYGAVSGGLRAHPTAQVAHTSPTRPALLTDLHLDPANRMTPHAFVIRGEAGQRADEALRWWYQDSDWDWTARRAGGVLSVRGPRVVNSLANTTTRGLLAQQADKDRATFETKWTAR